MKKLISLVLVTILALSLATAFATVPSKTTTDLAKVIDIETTGEKPADDFAIVIVEDSEAAKAELEKILEFVKEGNTPAKFELIYCNLFLLPFFFISFLRFFSI